MAFKVSSQRSRPARPSRGREEIYALAVKAGIYFMLAQGAFYLLITRAVAMWTTARYGPESFPHVKHLGLALLVLGWFLHNALTDPNRQKTMADALNVYFVGCVLVTVLAWRYSSVTLLEKIVFLVNFAFAVVLLKYRPEGWRVVLTVLAWVPFLKKFAPAPAPPLAAPEPPGEQAQ